VSSPFFSFLFALHVHGLGVADESTAHSISEQTALQPWHTDEYALEAHEWSEHSCICRFGQQQQQQQQLVGGAVAQRAAALAPAVRSDTTESCGWRGPSGGCG
jgi:hypothetical protein